MSSASVTADQIAPDVEAVLRAWRTPGLALAVVKDGAVILRQGFGVADVEQQRSVTPATLFAIGSATKAFTTLALGMLVDENKLDWDHPIREYLPEFQLHDAFATERMTPRDLVTHRSGLPRHDLMWYNSPFTREEIVARLRYLEPSKDFRALFQYQNLMYMTAGFLVGHLAGTTWEAFVQERIFNALDMRSSNLSVTQSQATPDHALPHLEKAGVVERISFRNIDTVGPAGSINSNLDDMLQWLLLHLNKGRHGERRIVSEANLSQMHAPQMVMQDAQMRLLMQAELASYGMGWFIQSHRGRVLVHHGGNIDGFSALVSFMPEERVGVVALTNLNGSGVPRVISYMLYDRLLGLDGLDWNQRLKKVDDDLKAALKLGKETSSADRKPDTRPSHPLDDYAGTYGHPGYGTLAVERDGERLKLTYNSIEYLSEHYHYDTFEMRYDVLDLVMMATFATDAKGNISQVAIPMEPNVADIVFTRLPDQRMRDRAFLERFTGDYELMGMLMRVFLKGEDTLVVSLPGQPEQELMPYQGTEFSLKGLSGVSIRFKRDETGMVREALLIQPGATFTVPRK